MERIHSSGIGGGAGRQGDSQAHYPGRRCVGRIVLTAEQWVPDVHSPREGWVSTSHLGARRWLQGLEGLQWLLLV